MSVTRAFVPAMRRRGRGRVVNISSIVGRVSAPFQGPYAASKHALEALSDALRAEMAPFGVRVVVVQPGHDPHGVLRACCARQMDAATARTRRTRTTSTHLDEIVAAMEKSAVPAERVARVVRKALTTRWPRARYVVPRRQRIIMALATNLPAFSPTRGSGASTGTAPPRTASPPPRLGGSGSQLRAHIGGVPVCPISARVIRSARDFRTSRRRHRPTQTPRTPRPRVRRLTPPSSGRSTARGRACSPSRTPTATGSASCRATASSNPNTSCSSGSSARRTTRTCR